MLLSSFVLTSEMQTHDIAIAWKLQQNELGDDSLFEVLGSDSAMQWSGVNRWDGRNDVCVAH